MNINIEILNEAGYEEAMLGLSLSYNQPVCKMKGVADRIYDKGSHGKFLESISVWLDLNMPRYWWQEFAEYRVGRSSQSESTMHTITKRLLTQDDFVEPIYESTLEFLNKEIEYFQCIEKDKDFKKERLRVFRSIKRNLPEGFLQRRQICTNYKTIRHIISQRENHRLIEWVEFCKHLKENCRYSEWLK